MIKFSDSVIISSDKIDKSTIASIKSHSKDSLGFKDSSDDDKLMEFLLKNWLNAAKGFIKVFYNFTFSNICPLL